MFPKQVAKLGRFASELEKISVVVLLQWVELLPPKVLFFPAMDFGGNGAGGGGEEEKISGAPNSKKGARCFAF